MSDPVARRCLTCEAALLPFDGHDRCPPCLGLDHAVSAFEGPGCPYCVALDASALLIRYELAKQRPRGPVREATPGLASSASGHEPEPMLAAPVSLPILAYHGGSPSARAARSVQPPEPPYVASTSGVEYTNPTPTSAFSTGARERFPSTPALSTSYHGYTTAVATVPDARSLSPHSYEPHPGPASPHP